MSHTLVGRQSATVETFGGLELRAQPQDLPEGASPRCFDVDLPLGGVQQRPGLLSEYSYEGESVGPVGGGRAVNINVGGGSAWANPSAILADDSSYTTTSVANSGTLSSRPTAGSNGAIGFGFWTNPNNVGSSTSFTTASGAGSQIALLISSGYSFNVPSLATITGVTVSFRASASMPSLGHPTIAARLVVNGSAPPGPFSTPITSTNPLTYTLGSPTSTWGWALTPAIVNNPASFQVDFSATSDQFPPSHQIFNLNNVIVTIYYTTTAISDPLQVTQFGFNVSQSAGIAGIEVDLSGFQDSSDGDVTVQLLQNGTAVGSTRTIALPTTQGVVSLGGNSDAWGFNWVPDDINNTQWGIQITAGGSTKHLNYAQVTIFQTPALANFVYITSYQQSNGLLSTLALDANGVLWQEDVLSNPGVLTSVLETITPGSAMKAAVQNDRLYCCFSDFLGGIDIPRQYDGTNFDRLTQVGPGAPPSMQGNLGAGTSADITAWSITSNVVTFTATNSFTAGEIVTITGLTTGSFLNGKTFSILSTGLSSSQFEVAFTHANTSASETGTAIPQYAYPLAASNSIKQPTAVGGFNDMLWSSGPGSTSQGNVITIYYKQTNAGSADTLLTTAFQSGVPTYVFVTGAQFGNGTQLVTGVGQDTPPGAGAPRWYFTYQSQSVGYQHTGGNGHATGTYQMTVATVTAASTSPIPNLGAGDQVTITGASPSGWNNTWQVSQTLNSGVFTISSTSMTNGVATYNYSLVSGTAPSVGQLVTITGTLNGNGVFNVQTAVVNTTGSGFFTITGFADQTIPSAAEEGTATTFGLTFQIDPGALYFNNPTFASSSPIFGTASGGTVTVAGAQGTSFPIAPGTRQAVCLFVTRNGDITPCSIPVQFTTGNTCNYIFASNIPIGPADVVQRIVAITEAGQEGIPGAFFYYIPVPVTSNLNNQTVVYSATVLNDNTTTTAKFTFTDSVLESATEIDIQGANYFENVEIGNSGWNVMYAGRQFLGLVENKVYNFNNLSFDGGFLPTPQSTAILPLGWKADAGSNPGSGNPAVITSFSITSNVVTFQAANAFAIGQEVNIQDLSTGTYLNDQTLTILATGLSDLQFECAFTHANVGSTSDSGNAYPLGVAGTLLNSPIFGNSYYIQNTFGETQTTLGMITQSAYQDAYNVAILEPNTAYSVRVTCRCPSGMSGGSLVVDFTDLNQESGYGTTYGSLSIPLVGMGTTMHTFVGDIINNNTFVNSVSPFVQLRLFAQDIPYLGDVEIDRIEIFPTLQPLGFPDSSVGVIGSYANAYGQFDINTGVIGLQAENVQTCFGAAVVKDVLFLLKTSSMYSTEDTPGQEPNNWSVREVSNKVGACGIHAYDIGKEYLVTACRAGLFAFNGGEPVSIMPEIQPLWDSINWNFGQTIWVKNDIAKHRMYVGVPLATPNQWLPDAPVNANPTSPNVLLVLNYEGLESWAEIVNEPGVHVTMFGAMADLDERRKWTIWQIPCPYGDFVLRANQLDAPLFLCNGIQSSKIYGLSTAQATDDGIAFTWNYTTYGFVNAAKAKENPLFGFHQKRYVRLQTTASGSGLLNISVIPNDLNNSDPKNPTWVVKDPPDLQSQTFDYVRNMNLRAERAFVQFTGDGTNLGTKVSKLIIVGNMDPHSPMPQIPGR